MTKKATRKGNTVDVWLYEFLSVLDNLFIAVSTLPTALILVETVQSPQLKPAPLVP